MGGKAWRVVEGQHVVSTRKLVDSTEEQQILEQLIETSKPRAPSGPEYAGLHYLLSTPFRYPPLRYGSRFGTRDERSIWYGSARPRTAFAETAYYRLLFLEGTTADIEPLSVELSLFHVPLRTGRGVDLTRPPFERYREIIASAERYGPTQRLGREMRRDGVHAFRYPAARDVRRGSNFGVFNPAAFARHSPSVPETWHCFATREWVELTKKDFFNRRVCVFPRRDFEVRGRLPEPAP